MRYWGIKKGAFAPDCLATMTTIRTGVIPAILNHPGASVAAAAQERIAIRFNGPVVGFEELLGQLVIANASDARQNPDVFQPCSGPFDYEYDRVALVSNKTNRVAAVDVAEFYLPATRRCGMG
jgi:hypothetical protein